MSWYGDGPHPQVCWTHATVEQRAGATARLDRPFDLVTADPRAPYPGISITAKFFDCEIAIGGWLARIHGTDTRYDLAREFLSRSGPPWGWRIPGNGLYECGNVGPGGGFSCFFRVKGAFIRRVEFVSRESAMRLAKTMGPSQLSGPR